MKPVFATLFVAATLGLAGCSETTDNPSQMTTSSTPTAADQACLTAVSQTTNNSDVAVLKSQFSEAGTQVTVGVGPQRAPWNCIAYKDGTTAGIESLTNEGTL